MRIPEPLFVFVNIVVRVLLKSPFHGLMSSSVLLITYVGRKSGKSYTTPVRYMQTETSLRCFTSDHVQWWRNVKASPTVTLRVGGTSRQYQAKVLDRDPGATGRRLEEYLALFPQDAAYQEIRLNPDGRPNSNDLAAASHKAIVVEFREN